MVKKASKPKSKKPVTVDIVFKSSHNYLGTLEKPKDTTTFDSIIDTLSSSKYKTLLQKEATIYLGTQRQFWNNAKLAKQDDKVVAITSTIKGILVTITSKSISEVFELDDLEGKNSFQKIEYQTYFLERGYDEDMKINTLQKGSFPPATGFYFIPFHCVSQIKLLLSMRYL
ncbi:hypothetical protein Hanom_Chr06g00563391 [Helianthus anomalus]